MVDSVAIDYEGKLIDGTVFDSSYQDKTKLTVPLSSIIKAWREALQLIGERGKIEFVAPSRLAYGDKGSYPQIPQGATLHFTVELFKIEKFTVGKK